MKIKLYYFYDGESYMDESDRMIVGTVDWRGEYQRERVFLKEEEVEVPDCAKPSDGEIVKAMTETLNNEKQLILAKTHKKIAQIDDKIRQLAALTYTEEK